MQLISFAFNKEFGDDLGILVAAYPEIHPESETLDIDISFFKEK